MARYVNVIQTPVDPESLISPLITFLQNEGFKNIDYKGASVWKKGVGVMTAPQYVSITCVPGGIQLEAFIKFALLPGVYVGEMGTKGFFGAIPKAMLKSRVESIEQYLYSLWQQNAPVQPAQTY